MSSASRATKVWRFGATCGGYYRKEKGSEMNGKLSCQYCSGPTNLQNGKLGDGFYVLCYCGRSGPTRDSAAQAIGDWSMGKETAEERDALKEKVAALEAENAELRELAEEMLEYVVLIGGTFPARLAVKAAGIFAEHDAEKGRDDDEKQ